MALKTQEVKAKGVERVLDELKNRLLEEALAALATRGDVDDSPNQELEMPPELLERLRV